MAHPDLVKVLLNDGTKLNSVLASNCVMDWFGRTFVGRRKVTEFYKTINADHLIEAVQSTEAFEDNRSVHLLSREHPIENAGRTLDETTWFDCEPSSPSCNDGQRTPEQKLSPPKCPPAPSRSGLLPTSSSDDSESFSGDEISFDESGCFPLDSIEKLPATISPKAKRTRRQHKIEVSSIETLKPEDSTFSDLNYMEGHGSVTLHRQACSEPEKRDCKVFVSYRVNKDDSSILQIALIVYKPFRKNVKTRRNLMNSFAEKSKLRVKSSTPQSTQTSTSTTPLARTTEKLLKRKFRF